VTDEEGKWDRINLTLIVLAPEKREKQSLITGKMTKLEVEQNRGYSGSR